MHVDITGQQVAPIPGTKPRLPAAPILHERPPDARSGVHATGTPNWSLKILSGKTRQHDLTTKHRIYWSLDPGEEAVRVFELRDARYRADPTVLRPGQTLECPLAELCIGV